MRIRTTTTDIADTENVITTIAGIVKGQLVIEVSNPSAFVADGSVQRAILLSIGLLANISVEYVDVALNVVLTRNLEEKFRRLDVGSVLASYVITMLWDSASAEKKLQSASLAWVHAVVSQHVT